jgi:hypothetical protein
MTPTIKENLYPALLAILKSPDSSKKICTHRSVALARRLYYDSTVSARGRMKLVKSDPSLAAVCRNSQQEWPAVLRLVWLTGGLVAVNQPAEAEVSIKCSASGRTFAALTIKTYPEIFSALRSLGFRIVGTTLVTNARELEGPQAPQFWAAGLSGGWPVWDATQQWKQIAFASSRQGHSRLMDVAARVSAALRYSEMRLYDLGDSYSRQLHGRVQAEEPKPYVRFNDTFSSTVYKDIHSMFWEMAVLRDVLAEFIAVFCLGRSDATTLSGLLRSLNKSSSADSFAEEVQRIANRKSPEGWLGRFGSYRDCFTHSAPLNLVTGSAFAVQDQLILKDGSAVPQIYYPLPEHPEQVMHDRAKGVAFDPSNPSAPPRRQKHDRAKEPDALEYLQGCLCQQTDLAVRLIARSSVAPEPIALTKGDIIGDIKIVPTR